MKLRLNILRYFISGYLTVPKMCIARYAEHKFVTAYVFPGLPASCFPALTNVQHFLRGVL